MSNSNEVNDSIDYYIKQTKNTNLELNERRQFILKGYNCFLSNEKNIPLSKLLEINYATFVLKDSSIFNIINNKLITLSSIKKDTLLLAEAYRFKGNAYSRIYKNNFIAFHFFNKALTLYYSINNHKGIAISNYYLGKKLKDFRQFNSAENHFFEAVIYFTNENEFKNIAYSYDALGHLYLEEKEYLLALEFQQKSLQLAKEHNLDYINTCKINLGNVYSKVGDYNNAIYYFQDAINSNHEKNNYRAKDNLAYAKYKAGINIIGTDDSLIKYYQLKSIDKDTSGMVLNRIRLSEVYFDNNNLNKAIHTANEALNLATLSNKIHAKLHSYEWLINIDKDNSQLYSKKYIALRDSSDRADRETQNKLARIRMDTDFFIEKSDKLEERNYWFVVSTVLGIITTLLIVFFFFQRIKNIRYSTEASKKEAIKKILVKENLKLISEKKNMANNIAMELHDNILSQMFAVRMNLSVTVTKNDKITIDNRKDQIEELKKLEKDIRSVSHQLKSRLESSIKKAIENEYVNIFKNLDINLIINDDVVEWNKYSEEVKIALYRIIQEGLNNIRKHSKANNALISFYTDSTENIICIIEDDGIGFKKGKNPGIGLSNINDRAKEINSKIEIMTEINKGTLIKLIIPLERH